MSSKGAQGGSGFMHFFFCLTKSSCRSRVFSRQPLHAVVEQFSCKDVVIQRSWQLDAGNGPCASSLSHG